MVWSETPWHFALKLVADMSSLSLCFVPDPALEHCKVRLTALLPVRSSAAHRCLPSLCLWSASEGILRHYFLYFCSVGIVAAGAFVTILVNRCACEMAYSPRSYCSLYHVNLYVLLLLLFYYDYY